MLRRQKSADFVAEVRDFTGGGVGCAVLKIFGDPLLFGSGLDRLRPKIPTTQHMERRLAAVERSVSPDGEGSAQWERA